MMHIFLKRVVVILVLASLPYPVAQAGYFRLPPPPPPLPHPLDSMSPAIDAEGVKMDHPIQFEFVEPINANTINSRSFYLETEIKGKNDMVGRAKRLRARYEVDGNTATLIPTQKLSLDKTYTVTITTRAQTEDGDRLNQNFSWDFTITAPAARPVARQWRGIKRLGSARADYAKAMAFSINDTLIVAGETTGDIAGTGLIGNQDIFITKYNTIGQKLFTKQFGSLSNDFVEAVVTDAQGNIYLTGYTMGQIGDNAPRGRLDIFIAKFNHSGVKQWITQIGTPHDDGAYGLAISGNQIYLAGYSDANFASGEATSHHAILMKLNKSNGRTIWLSEMEDLARRTEGHDVTIVGNDVYMTGIGEYHQGPAKSFFITRHTKDNHRLRWSTYHGRVSDIYRPRIGLDQDDILVAGQTNGQIAEHEVGVNDIFMSAFANGEDNALWIEQMGTRQEDELHDMITKDGYLYLVGNAAHAFGGEVAEGDGNGYLIKYSLDDKRTVWSRFFNPGDQSTTKAVIVDDDDNIYVTGDMMVEGRSTDVFIKKFRSNGDQY